MSVKCLVIGDVNGSFREAFKKISSLHTKNCFAFAIVAGNLFDNEANDEAPDLDDLITGQINIPLPIYFALGKSLLPTKVVEKLDANNGEVCENLVFLGKRTTIKTSEGIRIVALGGSLNPDLTAEVSKDRYTPSYSLGDAKSLRGANTADILITTDWPKNILKGSKTFPSGKETSTEQETIADLCATLKPRYHFSTNTSSFFEREPFFHPPAQDNPDAPTFGITRFISLAPYGNSNKAKWIYAFNIDPTAAPSVTTPAGATPSPLLPSSKKRSAPPFSQPETGFSRYAKSAPNSHHQNKRSKRQQPPGPDSCFFCLSNPTVETHLVTSIGEDAYMTTAKGPVSTAETFSAHGLACPAHMLIIPLPHVPTLASITDLDSRRNTIQEMKKFRSRVVNMLQEVSNGRLGAVTWTVSRATGVHAHWQVLPVPADLIAKGLVEAAFKVEAENEGYASFEKSMDMDEEELGIERSDVFRVWICDGGERTVVLTLLLSEEFKFDLNFGRRVFAKLFGLEKRLSWRDCMQSVQEETADVEAWKGLFNKWDFSLV